MRLYYSKQISLPMGKETDVTQSEIKTMYMEYGDIEFKIVEVVEWNEERVRLTQCCHVTANCS